MNLDSQPGEKPPIAVVGIGCRMPGSVKSPQDFWKVLMEGRDVITEVPPHRWSIDSFYDPDQSNHSKMVTRRCGFIDDVEMFDNAFFKISPREATSMDPQQRHMLEITYDAFQDAGIIPETLGDTCGVYIGVGLMDYPIMTCNTELTNPYTLTGIAHSSIANRISYVFNLRGPSMAIDTACAASINAMHIACNAIWEGECSTAVAGACNAILLPEMTVGFSALGVLAPDGKSCPFSDTAQGYVRSEGFGALILKPLEEALANNDHVYAVIRGIGVAASGFSKSITMPSTDAQEMIMRKTYERFNLPLSSVNYIEAHGTGTPVGDPIEAEAIGATFGAERTMPIKVGSVKSNFGHNECAAGIAAAIKVILMLENKHLVPTINFNQINPAIDLKKLNLQVQTDHEEIENDSKPYTIGLNSFGFVGAVGHMVFQEAHPAISQSVATCGWSFASENMSEGTPIVIPLSAKTPEALKDLAINWTSFSSSNDALSVSSWQATRREHHKCRLAVIADSADSFRNILNCYTQDKGSVSLIAGIANQNKPKICFVFPGQGQQWVDMGRSLFQVEPIFRDTLLECDNIFKQLSGWSILEACSLFNDNDSQSASSIPASEAIKLIHVIQPAIFFIQVGIYNLWRHWGVEPDVVVGHSLGESAAAYVCGGLTLREAVSVIFHRSREQAKLVGTGRMAALRATAKQAKDICAKRQGVYISAVNGPGDVTLGGDTSEIAALVAENPGKAKQLRVTCPFHTPVMDPIKGSFEESMKGVVTTNPGKRTVPYYSTVTGHYYQGAFDTQYWWDNIRKPVLFQSAVEEILQDTNIDIFLEVSSAATLLASVKQIIRSFDPQRNISTIYSGLRDKDDLHSIQRGLGSLYVVGVDINWSNVTRNAAQWAPIPTYPWQHKPFWLEREDARKERLGIGDRSFKGKDGKISLADFPYLVDHQLNDQTVFPAAGYVEYFAEMNFEEKESPAMTDITFSNALVWPDEDDTRKAVLNISQTTENEYVQVECENSICCKAMITTKLHQVNSDTQLLSKYILKRCDKEICGDEFCQRIKLAGFQYGPAFQKVERVLVGEGESVAYLTPIRESNQRISIPHLDAAFQLAQFTAGPCTSIYLPAHIDSLRLTNPSLPVGDTLMVYTQVLDCDSNILTADITIAKESGTILAEIKGYKGHFHGSQVDVDINSCIYATKWQPIFACTPSPKMIEDIFKESHLQTTYTNEMNAIRRVEEVLDDVEGICASYIKHALETVPELERAKNQTYDKYMARFNKIASLSTVKDIPHDNISKTIERILTNCPEFDAELGLIKCLGDILPDTLRDPKVAMPVMFSQDGLHRYFYDSITTGIFYKAIAEAVTKVVEESLKCKHVVRIVEIGGRTGGLTRFVLEPLKELGLSHRLEYVFTDFSATFFRHAQEQLVDFPFIQYKPYDVEREISEQGYVPGSFDIVICMDQLHGTIDVERSAGYMSHLLAPNGLMFIMEATNTHFLAELCFVSLEVCWMFDDFRQNDQGTCWLDRQGWANIMRKIDLQEVTSVSTPREFFHSVIVGRSVKSKDIVTNGNVTKEAPSRLLIVQDFETKFKEEMQYAFNGNIDINSSLNAKTSQLLSNDYTSTPLDIIYVHSDADSKLHALLKFLQAVEKHSERIRRVWMLTRSTNKESPDPIASLAVGMIRAFSNKIPDVPIFSINFDTTCDVKKTVQAMMNVIEDENVSEREIVIREGVCYVPRTVHQELQTNKMLSENWRLEQEISEKENGGSFDDLAFFDVNNYDIPSGHVKISVRASPLNFNNIKMYAEFKEGLESEPCPYFGMECAGVVDEVGEDVSSLKVGDEVIAFGQKCLASHVICSAHLTTLKPQNLNWKESASIGMAFVTAYFSLVERACLKPGETVLIHSACDAVGLAAIQIARMLGAKVMCTAGSNQLRSYLRTVPGVEFVSDSCSTQFYDDAMSFTEGRGVDVVLNSLSGTLLYASMSALAPCGRFCDIDNRDILQNSNVSIKKLLTNKDFLSCELDTLVHQSPLTVQRLMKKIVNLFEADILHPFPFAVYSLRSMVEAFTVMAKGSNIGNLVFDMNDGFQPEGVKPALQEFPSRATYIVTGGTGGIGQALVRWLCNNGAKHVVLVSRNGPKSASARRMINYLRGKGISVKHYDIDISNFQSVKFMLEDLRRDRAVPPIKGIFHLAGIFEYGACSYLTATEMDEMLDAKANGAFHLHTLTKEDDLDIFFLVSSVMALWGNPAQTTTTAADNYLDSLAEHRHSKGLPALSVQLGPIRGAGYLEDREDIVKVLKKTGHLQIHVNEFLNVLGSLLQQKHLPVVCLANQNWKLTQQYCHQSMLKFHHLTTMETVTGEKRADLTEEDMEESIKCKMADILCMPVDSIDINQPMINYGVDSLVAIELVAWATSQLGLAITQEEILGGISTAAVLEKAKDHPCEDDDDLRQAHCCKDYVT